MKIRITSGPQSGETIDVSGSRIIGSEGDIRIEDAGASARHAALRPTLEGALEIEDLGSENGTFVNGERISTVTPLYGTEEVRLGDTTLVVEPDATSVTRVFTSPVARVGGLPANAAPEAPAPPAARPPAPRRAPLATKTEASGAPSYAFAPPNPRRRSWAETRKTLPTVLMTAVILADGAGLALYFAGR